MIFELSWKKGKRRCADILTSTVGLGMRAGIESAGMEEKVLSSNMATLLSFVVTNAFEVG